MKKFYAPSFLDESKTFPNKSGNSRDTGKLQGLIFCRRFFKSKNLKLKAERFVVPFTWKENTEEAKAEALSKAIEGMEEMPELDSNPPLHWIPDGLTL